PIDETQLEELRRTGRIQPSTLVWREGMPNWTPFSEVQGELKPSFSLKGEAGPGGPTAIGAVPEAVCTECNRIYPTSSMIRYGEAHVCANCKPVFLQKLSEGARIGRGGTGGFAGFWIRFGARILDGILLAIVNFIISIVVMGGTAAVFAGGRSTAANGAVIGAQLMLWAIQIGIALGYETFMIGRFGATLGKMACRIQVVTADGAPVSYPRALGRYFATWVSSLTCAIGYIIAAFDSEKRALHDHICGTRVVYK